MTAHPLETTGLTLCATVSIGTTPAAAAPSDRQWAVETGGKVGLSPTIVNSTVYVGSEDGNLYALDAANGTERWRYETGETAADVRDDSTRTTMTVRETTGTTASDRTTTASSGETEAEVELDGPGHSVSYFGILATVVAGGASIAHRLRGTENRTENSKLSEIE